MPRKRRLRTPARSKQKLVPERTLRQLRAYADLHTAFLDAMKRDNSAHWLRRLAELRNMAELILGTLFPTAETDAPKSWAIH